jgi:hypothetical protein
MIAIAIGIAIAIAIEIEIEIDSDSDLDFAHLTDKKMSKPQWWAVPTLRQWPKAKRFPTKHEVNHSG